MNAEFLFYKKKSELFHACFNSLSELLFTSKFAYDHKVSAESLWSEKNKLGLLENILIGGKGKVLNHSL